MEAYILRMWASVAPGSGQQIRDFETGFRLRERRDRVARTQDEPGLIYPVLRIAIDLEYPADQIAEPGLRNPGAGVQGDLPLAVVQQRAVGDLHDQQGRRGVVV